MDFGSGSDAPLSRRLRDAAIERTRRDVAQRIGPVIIDRDGVIDLRHLPRPLDDDHSAVSDPAAALAGLRGRYDGIDLRGLYAGATATRPSRGLRSRVGRRRDRTAGIDRPDPTTEPG